MVDLYKGCKQAVSYIDVASAMKVSKWTAYDILHGLYQRGFLRMTHEIKSSRGRSQIFYSPAENLLREGKSTAGATRSTTLKWLMGKIKQYAGYSIAESVKIVGQRVRREKNPFQVVLYTELVLVLFVRVFQVDVDRLVNTRAVVAAGLSADTVLRLLSEVMFSFMRNEKWLNANLASVQQSIEDFTEWEGSFEASVAQLSVGEKSSIVSAMREAFAW
jgi:hypothetical protein